MPIEERHVSNYDELTRHARENGFTDVRVVLQTGDIGQDSSILVVPTGQRQATVVVNESALKPTPEFTSDHMQHQLRRGQFAELTPELAENYGAMAQAAANAGYTTPPRVVLDSANSPDSPATRVSELPDGTPLVRVNPSIHQWTPEYARDNAMPTNEAFAQALASGSMRDVSDRIDPSVMQYLRQSAERRGLSPDMSVILDRDATIIAPTAGAMETREGTRHVVVNEGFMNLKPEQQRAVIDHELAHFQLGHTSAQGYATDHNSQLGGSSASTRAREANADRVGICYAYDPSVTGRHLADALSVMADQDAALLRGAGNPNMTNEEIAQRREVVDRDHPPMEQRIRDIREYSSNCGDIAPIDTPRGSTGGGRHK